MAVSKREGVMLCYPATTKRVQSYGDSVLAQPKLNGARCRVEWFKGKPVLISSFGNQFKFLNHIENALSYLPAFPYDGELYVHGWSRERIQSAISQEKSPKEDSALVEYHIFDIQTPDLMQYERLHQLLAINFTKPLVRVPTTIIGANAWQFHCQEYTDAGYEGIILRNPVGLYKPVRSVDIQKFKPTHRDCYKILAVKEAISEHGDPMAMVGSFIVTSPTVSESFSVGAGKLSHTQRTVLWEVRDTLPGQYLTVKHESLKTSSGIPLCCVAIAVSNFEITEE